LLYVELVEVTRTTEEGKFTNVSSCWYAVEVSA
jgi:hypothetical protein